MQRDELLKNSGYWVAKIQIDLYNQLTDYMKTNGLNRTQLSKKLGVTKGYISQILNGDFDHRISKLVDLSLSIGKVPKIEFEDIDQLINDDKIGYVTYKWKFLNNLKSPESFAGLSNETTNETTNDLNMIKEPSQRIQFDESLVVNFS